VFKACIDVTLYDELFITSIPEKFFLSHLKDNLTDGHFHLGVISQPIATLWIKVWAQPTAKFPPFLPDVAVSLPPCNGGGDVSEGVTLRSQVSWGTEHVIQKKIYAHARYIHGDASL
jgi:hypothetical protein